MKLNNLVVDCGWPRHCEKRREEKRREEK